MGKVTIIAELGSSPAPDWNFAPWCAAAANAGADAVKVQLFTAEHFPPAEQDAKRRLEFPRGKLIAYKTIAHAYGLSAGASVFDAEAVTLAAQTCDWLKLAAREQFNHSLRLSCHETNKRTFRSVSDWRDNRLPNETLLFAIQRYPSPLWLALFEVVKAARRYRKHPAWGWSSHTTGYLDCTLAARLGASVIEKHLALWPTDLEAGHSLLPAQFAAMCCAIRKGETHAAH